MRRGERRKDMLSRPPLDRIAFWGISWYSLFIVAGVVIGIGLAGQSDTGEHPSQENVQLNFDGGVVVYCDATEFGPGTRDVMRKIAAEELNVDYEMVQVTPADSISTPTMRATSVGMSCKMEPMPFLAPSVKQEKRSRRRRSPDTTTAQAIRGSMAVARTFSMPCPSVSDTGQLCGGSA